MSIVFLQPHFLLSWIWNNFSHIYNTEFLVWLTPLFLLCLYNICLIFTLIPSYINLVLLKGILPLHPPPHLHIHLVVFPQRSVILFFNKGILSMPIFINLNHAHVWLLLSDHFVSWLWGLLFLWWDPFCHHKDQGNGMWKSTGKEELQIERHPFVRPRPATDLKSFGTGSGDGKAGWQMPSHQGDGLGNVSTTSSMLLSELLSSEKAVLSGLKNATFCVYYSENRRQYMRICVISNQGITPGGQSSNNLLFLLDCWEAFISFVNFGFRTCWKRK